MIQHSSSARVQWPRLADFRPVGLILPVFLRILPDILCDEWPSNLLTRLKYTLCVIWSEKKKTGISIVAVVLSYTLPLGLTWQPDWWQISVAMSARKIVFLQNSFQLTMSALILSMYYDFRITWDWGSLFQSSTNPLVSNSPPLPLTLATQSDKFLLSVLISK